MNHDSYQIIIAGNDIRHIYKYPDYRNYNPSIDWSNDAKYSVNCQYVL